MSAYVFTSEAVTAGHPDKLCDQISDELVGRYLRQDPLARVNAECAVSTGILFASVKAAADATVDVPNAARQVIVDVGYTSGSFNGKTCTVMTNLSEMPDGYPRLNEATATADQLDRLVAQDNVTLFGFACNHTPSLLPLPIWLANRIVRQLDLVRARQLDYLTPDGKCQVAVAFRDHVPTRIDSITLVASQNGASPPLEQLRRDLRDLVIEPVFEDEQVGPDGDTRIVINPEGQILEGGPALHAGLTGRKNAMDTYGSYSRHSGAALSGKDPTRIDRIGAYAARYAAKNLVAAGLATHCEVQLSYSIGMARPVSVHVDTFRTGRMSDDELTERVVSTLDLRPASIIKLFGLRQILLDSGSSFYRRLATYGHVGRTDIELPWERTDLAHVLAN